MTLFGKRIYLGKYGSAQSYQGYAEAIARWRKSLGQEQPSKDEPESPFLESITAEQLREKQRAGAFISINELIVVYRRHARSYYRKNGEVTREAGNIDDALKFLRKHHGKESACEIGPVDLDALREKMIDDLDWSRKYLNKQIGRIVRMFKWAVEKEIVPAKVHSTLENRPGTLMVLLGEFGLLVAPLAMVFSWLRWRASLKRSRARRARKLILRFWYLQLCQK